MLFIERRLFAESKSMAPPEKVTGYGNNSTARNVFAFYTDQPLSAPIKYYCYDNNQTFPTVDSVETILNDIFVNGDGGKSMICLVDTSNAAPSSNWKPSAHAGGEANPNRMLGNTDWVEQDGANLGAGGRATFNMVIEIPSTALTSYDMRFDLTIKYSYTSSTAPTPLFQYNIGTEGTPSWQTATPGTHGIKHTRAGVSAPDLFANIPETGTEDTAEGWITT